MSKLQRFEELTPRNFHKALPSPSSPLFTMAHLRSLSSRRHPDPTFEKLMSTYKNYIKALRLRDLILSSPTKTLPLSLLAHPHTHQRLNLPRGAPPFLRSHPHLFVLSPDPTTLAPVLSLTPAAAAISAAESAAAAAGGWEERLVRVLRMSREGAVPMRAVFRVWREMGLPDDFEERVSRGRRDLFRVRENLKERNTHLIELVDEGCSGEGVVERVEEWRRRRRTEEDGRKKVDEMELRLLS